MIASLTALAALLAGLCDDNNASPTGGSALTTLSKMRTTDLESSASEYAYNQRTGLPATYMLYTNHGSGRYYGAPAPVHYVVGGPAPVAQAVSETASSHGSPVLPAYASARHEIAPYVATLTRPYPRDGVINYGAGQLAKYARPLEPSSSPPLPAARAPYYTANLFASGELDKNIEERNDDAKIEDDNESDDPDDESGEENSDSEEEGGDRVTQSREETIDFTSNRPIDDVLDDLRPNIDVSFEHGHGAKYSIVRDSASGENDGKSYHEREKFDVGERGRHDDSRQQGHYDTETENKKGYNDEAGNYGRYNEAERNEKSSSYGQTSYHKKGQKTSGFHKVYHKDEYKKDTDFYDESHKKGYFDKHVAADEHYNTAEGDSKRNEHRESGFDDENSGKKGYYDQVHTDNHDRGYNKQIGESSSHDNYENYSSDEDTHLTKKHEKSERHR